MPSYITKTEKETYELGKKFAATLKGGEIIGLIGDLGAGKTIFVKGLAKGLGVKRTVTSPTFVLMKVYKINKQKIKNLVHIDAYRLNSMDDLIGIGVEEYLSKQDSIVIIEWADKIKFSPKYKFKNINIKINKDTRKVVL